jgi:hypothetical protein
MEVEILYKTENDWDQKSVLMYLEKMKSKDVQTTVKNKYENGDGPAKIYRNLADVVSLQTIKIWIKMINNTGTISLSSPPSRTRTVRTKPIFRT